MEGEDDEAMGQTALVVEFRERVNRENLDKSGEIEREPEMFCG